MILMVYMMQKYIFSKVKSSHNAQNAQKWPSKYPKRPKTVQNPHSGGTETKVKEIVSDIPPHTNQNIGIF
jgi:hypothetical protein